jgi:serine/threonine protein kinase
LTGTWREDEHENVGRQRGFDSPKIAVVISRSRELDRDAFSVTTDVTVGAGPQSATVPEFNPSLIGSVIKARYRVKAITSVDPDVVVYSAEDTRHHRPIALKVLRDEFARDAKFVAAVRARSQALATPAHVLRGVQRVYECGELETGQLFVALDRVEGATLGEVIEGGGALAVPTALRVAIRVGEALEALHHNGLVHGRLGPDSVLMLNDGERISVVGAELAAAYRTPIGRRFREPFPLSYLAPEQLEGGEATEATDVYALGMLLRHVLTAGKGEQTPGAVAATPPLSPTIQRIIATALEPRPERRYPDITVMVNDIWGAAAAVTERERAPRSVKGRGNARRRVRRRQRPIALRMTAAVAMAGVMAAIVWIAGLDHIAAQLYRGVTPPAVTAVPVEPEVLRSSEAAAQLSAPREPTPSEAGAVENTPPAGPAAVIVPESPAAPPPMIPPRIAPSASARSTTDRRPRAVQSAAPIAPRAPVESSPLADRRRPVELPATGESSASIERRMPTERSPRVDSGADADDGSGAIDWLLKRRR